MGASFNADYADFLAMAKELIGEASELCQYTRPNAIPGSDVWNPDTGAPTVYQNVAISWESSPYRAYAALQLDAGDFVAAGTLFGLMAGDAIPTRPQIGDVIIRTTGVSVDVKYADMVAPDNRPILYVMGFDA